jgi:hypothetical protein
VQKRIDQGCCPFIHFQGATLSYLYSQPINQYHDFSTIMGTAATHYVAKKYMRVISRAVERGRGRRKTTFSAEEDISGEYDFFVADSGPPTQSHQLSS